MTGLREAGYCVAAMCLIVAGSRAVTRSATGAAPPPPIAAMPVAATASGAISLHADRSGHFTTTALVNGRAVSMMVDTGATLCAFGQADAESLGLKVAPGDFKKVVMTANGAVRVAPVRIRLLQIGPVAVRDVEAVVIPRGLLGTNLLGMSFLSRLRDFSVAGARITLRGVVGLGPDGPRAAAREHSRGCEAGVSGDDADGAAWPLRVPAPCRHNPEKPPGPTSVCPLARSGDRLAKPVPDGYEPSRTSRIGAKP